MKGPLRVLRGMVPRRGRVGLPQDVVDVVLVGLILLVAMLGVVADLRTRVHAIAKRRQHRGLLLLPHGDVV